MMDEDDIEAAEDINHERDAEDDRIRFSRLKLMAKSPAHYLHATQRDTSAKDKGTAVHALLNSQRVTFYPEKTKTGRSAPRNGEKWEQFQRDNQDAIIVTAKQYDEVNGMIESLRACREAKAILTGIHEETLRFDLLNLECRTTPDVRGDGFFTELKTSVSSDPRRFIMQSFWMSYHAQMALHRIGIKRAVAGAKPDAGYMVVVESTAPYPVTVFKMTDKAMDAGDKQIRRWMETLKGCIASNQWPPYAQSVMDLEVPEQDIEIGETYTAENLPEGW
jgi:PDDEXK-like domain of unknown function (DUF3799)